jgi:hypothetical protein
MKHFEDFGDREETFPWIAATAIAVLPPTAHA